MFPEVVLLFPRVLSFLFRVSVRFPFKHIFFLPYMDAWPVVCYPFRACWHSHFVPSLALGCLGNFLQIFSVFRCDLGCLFRDPLSEGDFFAVDWYFSNFFLEYPYVLILDCTYGPWCQECRL